MSLINNFRFGLRNVSNLSRNTKLISKNTKLISRSLTSSKVHFQNNNKFKTFEQEQKEILNDYLKYLNNNPKKFAEFIEHMEDNYNKDIPFIEILNPIEKTDFYLQCHMLCYSLNKMVNGGNGKIVLPLELLKIIPKKNTI